MTQKNNIEFHLEMVSHHALEWLDKAKQHKYIGEILNEKVLVAFENYNDNSEEETFRLSALIEAMLYHLALALELIIKGFIISQKPDFSNVRELYAYKWNASGGHGIKEMINFNFRNFKSDELELTKRLEEYLMWAGKYPNPKNKRIKTYIKEFKSIVPSFNTDDFDNFSGLFNKIEKELRSNWNKNYYKFNEWRDRTIKS